MYAPLQIHFSIDLSVVTMSKRTRTSIDNVCCFCGSSEDNELELGKFYKRGHIVTHYYCLVLSILSILHTINQSFDGSVLYIKWFKCLCDIL